MRCKVFSLIFLFCFLLGLGKVSFATQTEASNQTQAQKPLVTYPVPYVPVLSDMQYIPDKSAILKTPTLITGELVFKGNYSSKSLLQFYKVQMKNNGWKEIATFSSKVTLMVYKRPEGTVFISISPGIISTEVRIDVVLTKSSSS